MDVQTNVSTQDGEITKATKSAEPLIRLFVIGAAFVGAVLGLARGWIRIEDNTTLLKELKEQQATQYRTHRAEIDALKRDNDEELDVLEEELDKVKEEVIYLKAAAETRKEINR
jgi:hypothetical protein